MSFRGYNDMSPVAPIFPAMYNPSDPGGIRTPNLWFLQHF